MDNETNDDVCPTEKAELLAAGLADVGISLDHRCHEIIQLINVVEEELARYGSNVVKLDPRLRWMYSKLLGAAFGAASITSLYEAYQHAAHCRTHAAELLNRRVLN